MPRITPEQLAQLPSQPGVYQMKDADDGLLYVGKAKNLKHRVKSYFAKSAQHTPRIAAMVSQIVAIDYTMTQSEIDALILEANMIKTLRPQYNILMRDDKRYPWLVLTNEPYPRLVYTRTLLSKNGQVDWSKCFGPYPTAGALHQTLQVIKKLFPLRQRKKPLFKDRPCMNYHIGSCLGPCQKLVSQKEYKKMIDQVVLFLKGNGDDLLARLETEMQEASAKLEFEKAAMLRDRYQAVQQILTQQRVVYDDASIQQDVIGVFESAGAAYFSVFKVRHGRLVQTLFFDLPLAHKSTLAEAYEMFLFQYYQSRADLADLPNELLLQFELEDAPLLADWLNYYRNPEDPAAAFLSPRHAFEENLLALAIRNARESAENAQLEKLNRHQHDPAQALIQLEERLHLPQFPKRIECYDISHIQGTNTVASMVVFTDGLPDKAEYRRFNIQSVESGKPDDFQSMREVMTRRFTNREEKGWPDPDLIIIDGGKGQLSAAHGALKDMGITEQPIISLAKKFEEVFTPGKQRPLVLPRDSVALFLLQQLRDEAHRFAITAHRQKRQKAQTDSYLDNIPGIGPKRKALLQKKYPTQKAFAKATVDELAELLNVSEAQITTFKRALSLIDNDSNFPFE